MNERGGFIGAGGKGPGPCDAESVDVGLGDLLQRAETLIVERAAPCEPFAGGRVLEHGIGHGNRFVERVDALGSGRQFGAYGESATGTATAATGGAGNGYVGQDLGIGGELNVAGGEAVLLEDVSENLCVSCVGNAAGIAGRHFGGGVSEQAGGRFAGVFADEARAAQRGSELAVIERCAVATGTVLVIRGFACARLGGSEQRVHGRNDATAPGGGRLGVEWNRIFDRNQAGDGSA